jgi:glycosyltransferase involved in cell wall biosynthesis
MSASVICVLGMHRSGTSLVARMINLLGWDLGPRRNMLEVAPDNPKGFWEHRLLSEINREVLARLGGRWNAVPPLLTGWENARELHDLKRQARTVIAEDFGESPRWAWKDPRTCLTLPFWRGVLSTMRYVLVVRNPLDVAASLYRRSREPVSAQRSFDLWLTYVLASLRNTRGDRRLIVSYEALMADAGRELCRLESFLGGCDDTDRHDAALHAVDQTLWHHRTPPPDELDAPGLQMAAGFVYSTLLLGSHADVEQIAGVFDTFGLRTVESNRLQTIQDSLVQRAREVARGREREDGLRAELAARDREIGDHRGQLAAARTTVQELRERLSANEDELRTLRRSQEQDHREQAGSLRELTASVKSLERARSEDEHRGNDAWVRAIRAAVDQVIPRGARVLVASGGDEELLQLRGRRASHFPQLPGGVYAGADPTSSKEAVDHLEALRGRGAHFIVIPSVAFWWLDHFGGLREYLEDRCRLVHSDERCVVYDIHVQPSEQKRRGAERRRIGRRRKQRPARSTASRTRVGGRRSANPERPVGREEYDRIRRRIRGAVDAVVPKEATVVVASKGDDELLKLSGRNAWHYPQGSGGVYAGHHPADGRTALAHLDELRARGGEFFVLPSTALWWLDHYPELDLRLSNECRLVSRAKDPCLIYDLRGAPAPERVRAASEPRQAVTVAARSHDHPDRRAAGVADDALPPDAAVVAVFEPDDPPLDIGLRRVRRLPESDDQTAAQAVAQLERFRSEGAEFLMVPAGSAWWERRPGLRRYVESRFPVAVRDDACVVFGLGRPPKTSQKISVLCWDMGHNPLGRAHVLADLIGARHDVEIVGPHFDRYGSGIWKPLQDSRIPMRTFRGSLFPEYVDTVEEVAQRIDGDVLYVSKPRWPSYGLALLAKAHRNRPLLVDCDDREITFFGDEDDVIANDDLSDAGTHETEFYNPFGRTWTRQCESLVGLADHVTVSNHTLFDLFGGTIVPHARDERVFDPGAYDRDKVRAELGIAPDQNVVFFGGTVRKHKGIQEIAAALARIGDPRNRLCVIGTGDLVPLRRELGPLNDWLDEIPVQPFDRLPAVLAAADLVCLLQDVESGISRYQIPAKVTDALAMGVPCIATPVPPLQPLIDKEAILPLAGAPLHELIDLILRDTTLSARTSRRGREVFLEEFSYAAVRPRLDGVIASLAADPRPMPARLNERVEFQRSVFAERADRRRPRKRRRAIATSSTGPPASTPARVGHGEALDIVMFWKHNDTGIYGRRQDMLARYLARSERVNQIVHFDAPVDVEWLRRHLRPPDPQANHSRMLALRALGRVGRIIRDPKVHYHTFLHHDGAARRSLMSRVLPSPDRYIEWIHSVLMNHGVGRRPTVFWVYPRLFGFPEIADALAPDVVVSDIVDDDRTWLSSDSEFYGALTQNYEEILERSDIALASTESVREAMRGFAPDIHLVPNACEFPDPAPANGRRPKELRRLRGPVIGYVGNLSSRIDVALLEHLVTARPGWNLVLIGSAHLDREVLRLAEFPNVHVLGVKPYEQAKRYIRAFDVAIIPHVDGPMTRSMHPLKAFVYAAQNVPIVSTDIANLGELRPFVHIARGPLDFVWQIELVLAARRSPTMPDELAQVLEKNSWTRRVETILGLLGAHLASDETTRIGRAT